MSLKSTEGEYRDMKNGKENKFELKLESLPKVETALGIVKPEGVAKHIIELDLIQMPLDFPKIELGDQINKCQRGIQDQAQQFRTEIRSRLQRVVTRIRQYAKKYTKFYVGCFEKMQPKNPESLTEINECVKILVGDLSKISSELNLIRNQVRELKVGLTQGLSSLNRCVAIYREQRLPVRRSNFFIWQVTTLAFVVTVCAAFYGWNIIGTYIGLGMVLAVPLGYLAIRFSNVRHGPSGQAEICHNLIKYAEELNGLVAQLDPLLTDIKFDWDELHSNMSKLLDDLESEGRNIDQDVLMSLSRPKTSWDAVLKWAGES